MTPELARWLLDQRVTDGTGRSANLLDVLCNCTLLDDGVRQAFMVQPIDYSPRSVGVDVAKRLAGVGYAYLPIDQGIVICLPQNESKVASLLSTYEKKRDPSYLGKALSYPAADDFPDMDEPERIFLSWTVRSGRLEGDVMNNVCTNPKFILEGHRLAVRMAASLAPRGIVVEFTASASWGEED